MCVHTYSLCGLSLWYIVPDRSGLLVLLKGSLVVVVYLNSNKILTFLALQEQGLNLFSKESYLMYC